ncbi:MAG: SRPBCC family protein [Ilumatobacteraceae bacterium]
MESFHVMATHPQLLPGMGDTITQYDAFGNWKRHHAERGDQHPCEVGTHRAGDDRCPRGPGPGPGSVARRAEGADPRTFLADHRRRNLVPILGDDAMKLSDAGDERSLVYAVFPNFHPWGSYNRIVYRFRPWQNRPDRCLMEAMILSPYRGERPANAKMRFLDEDDDWTEADELGVLGRVFNQDVYNLPKVQTGLESGALSEVVFAEYQETKIRLFNLRLDEWMARPS